MDFDSCIFLSMVYNVLNWSSAKYLHELYVVKHTKKIIHVDLQLFNLNTAHFFKI